MLKIPSRRMAMLMGEELSEVLDSPHPGKWITVAWVDLTDRSLYALDGRWVRYRVPLSYLETGKTKPDFNDVAIRDSGCTVALGDYEIASDFIQLYPVRS